MKVYLVEKYCVTKCDDFYDGDDDDDDKDSIDNDDDKDSIDNDDDRTVSKAHRTRMSISD
jgi:hypothetical protein